MLNGVPVLDAVVHAYNLDPANYALPQTRHIVEMNFRLFQAAGAQAAARSVDEFSRDFSIEEVSEWTFAQTDTDLAVYHVLPIRAFRDGGCSLAKAVEAQQRWPDRWLVYAGVDPLDGPKALDDLEEQVETLHPVGLKLYPGQYTLGGMRNWRMDDAEIAYPVFSRALELGIKIIAIHKAIPMGPDPLDFYRMGDIDRAAVDFPEARFEVVHGGVAFLEETAWQLSRFPNVYVNLESTATFLVSRPLAFQYALAAMASVAGKRVFDRIMWGTGTGNLQLGLERFWDFAFDEPTMDRFGVPQLTEEDKAKILFGNYASMTGLGDELRRRLDSAGSDEFSKRRAAAKSA